MHLPRWHMSRGITGPERTNASLWRWQGLAGTWFTARWSPLCGWGRGLSSKASAPSSDPGIHPALPASQGGGTKTCVNTFVKL